jgi:hypothetical protein
LQYAGVNRGALDSQALANSSVWIKDQVEQETFFADRNIGRIVARLDYSSPNRTECNLLDGATLQQNVHKGLGEAKQGSVLPYTLMPMEVSTFLAAILRVSF